MAALGAVAGRERLPSFASACLRQRRLPPRPFRGGAAGRRPLIPSAHRRLSRSGHAAFTIVELLVSMALMIFMLAIFAQAFHVGAESFRDLKALGDMQEKLRSTTSLLRRDLRADHFDEARGNRLSDQDLATQGPPSRGFFRIWQGSAAVLEGQDSDGIPSY